MEHLKLKGKLGKISSESTITSEQLHALWDAADDKQKIAIASLGYAGMRTSEYLHMEPSWLHFDKSETKKYNYVPFIHIPGATKDFRQLCNCDDCQLRAYKEYRIQKEDDENDGKHLKHNSKWHQKVSRDFYKLKPTRKKKKDDLSRLTDLGIQGYWKPKSIKGSRDIPLILEDIKDVFLNYKENYDELRPKRKRLDAWWSVHKLGQKVLDTDISPHPLRATYISILGSSPEMTLNKLMSLSGHRHYSSLEPYMQPERREAIRVAHKISKDLFM